MASRVINLGEKRLEKLPADELSRHLMRLPAKKRLELVVSRADAESVVAALAEQDFYFFIKEIGEGDSLPLLALGRVEQLNHLFDLEWWQKDEILPAKALDWLERLSRASEEKLLAWLYHVDFELLVVLFKKWIQVAMAPEDTDLLEVREQLPENTLDDQFFWRARYPQYEDFIKGVLSTIYAVNYGYYKELMNYTIWPADSTLEEEAYHFHRARLEDHAIPDFYDALEIYQAIRPEDVSTSKDKSSASSLPVSAPSFAVALVPEKDFFSSVLREIQDDSLMSTLQFELASLANKVIAADQLILENPDILRFAVDKASAYVNIGLLLKSSGDRTTALNILREAFLEHLFRLGQSHIAILKNRLNHVKQDGWLSKWPAGLKCLEPGWVESAELLLRKTPLLLRSSPDPHTSPKEDFFRNQEDLAKGNHFVDVVISLGPLYDALQVQPERLAKSLWNEGQISTLQDMTLGAMIWTAAAQVQREGTWKVEPLSVREWPVLFSRLSPPAMEDVIRSWTYSILRDSTRRTLVNAYLNPLFQGYEEEMAPFDKHNIPDPSLTRLFIFSS